MAYREDIEKVVEALQKINKKYNLSTTHTENGVKVYYPSSKAVREALEKSMS